MTLWPEHAEAARLADARAAAVAEVERRRREFEVRGRALIEARRPKPRSQAPADLLVVLTETVEQRRARWRAQHLAAVERARRDIKAMRSS